VSGLDRVHAIVNGYQRTCLAAAAIELSIFDKLTAGERPIAELAKELEVDDGALARLIRALTVVGLTVQSADRVSLTDAARLLVKGGFASSLRAWTVLIGGEYLALWGRLADSVRSGGPVFESVFNCSAWKHREDRPALNAAFNEVTSSEQLRTVSTLLRSYAFDDRRCIADVGGGHGNLIAGVLKKYPALQGVVFDLPHVVEGARASLEAAGVADRCSIVPGSFLDSVPAGPDVHVLKHVLHNWDDANCLRILRHLRRAAASDGVLLILENVIPDSDLEAAAPLVMLDIHMLVVHGGRERTRAEYEGLLSTAGFRLSRLIATRRGVPDILEAMPV
jgi:hypothetical protein